MLVRFVNRKKRDAVLADRKKLNGKGFVIGEDLTSLNYKLSIAAHTHFATMAVWSTNGRILAKLKNGRVMRLDMHMDLDEAFRRGMSSNDMNEGGV